MRNKFIEKLESIKDLEFPNNYSKIEAENSGIKPEFESFVYENEKKYNDIEKALREVPVSINNYYGDPTLQWEDTLEKLDDLVETKHLGPVGLITKGKLGEKKCKELADYTKKGLKIVVFLSISELKNFEKIGQKHRYENISRLNKYGVRNIAYIRPMTPPYNTGKETIDFIFKQLKENGAKTIVASGFRGDDSIIDKMSPEEKMEWVLRVKQMEPETFDYIKQKSEENNMQYFTRTSCAVSYLVGDDKSYNPYYNSPHLVKCEELSCPLINTCKSPDEPKKGTIEFLTRLGYDLEYVKPNNCQKCSVSGGSRLGCKSCCTTCYMLDVPHILVKGNVSLGDLTFIRFVTGILTMQPGKNDDGSTDIANVTIPNYSQLEGIQCLNSWWAISKIGKKCFDCSYCISDYYKGNEGKNFGFSPARLLQVVNLEYNKILGD